MGFLARSLIFLTQLSLFLLFVVLRLDRTTTWLWHYVFLPLWIYDLFTLICLTNILVSHFRTGNRPYCYIQSFDLFDFIFIYDFTKMRTVFMLLMFSMKFLFTLILCLKLDGFIKASFVYVAIPFWLLVIGMLCDAFIITWNEGKAYYSR